MLIHFSAEQNGPPEMNCQALQCGWDLSSPCHTKAKMVTFNPFCSVLLLLLVSVPSSYGQRWHSFPFHLNTDRLDSFFRFTYRQFNFLHNSWLTQSVFLLYHWFLPWLYSVGRKKMIFTPVWDVVDQVCLNSAYIKERTIFKLTHDNKSPAHHGRQYYNKEPQ